MKKAFAASLCRRGVLGGGLYLSETALTFRTQKFTVEPKYRNLVLPLEEIESFCWKRTPFPLAVFSIKNGERYAFLIFNKPRFEKYFRQCWAAPGG